MTFGEVVAVVGEGLHRRCVMQLLVRVGIGSGMQPADVARAVAQGDSDWAYSCDVDTIGRMIGDLLADQMTMADDPLGYKVCVPCAGSVLAALDQ